MEKSNYYQAYYMLRKVSLEQGRFKIFKYNRDTKKLLI